MSPYERTIRTLVPDEIPGLVEAVMRLSQPDLSILSREAFAALARESARTIHTLPSVAALASKGLTR